MSPGATRSAHDEPLVTVIVPTHNHASTVDLAVASILRQSVTALDVVVIGDGAPPEVGAALEPLMNDGRLRYLDRPKSKSRNELTRHQVLTDATTTYVCYLGDDDLMLPGHLASTIEILQRVDFTHPLPVFIDGDGTFRAHPADLAEERCRNWHMRPGSNAVGLSGVGHRVDAYRRLPDGWKEPPPGRWSDHWMWQQWFAEPDFTYETGEKLTILKFEGARRPGMTDADRRSELELWLARSEEPGFESWLAMQAAGAFRREALLLRLGLADETDRLINERHARVNDGITLDRERQFIADQLLQWEVTLVTAERRLETEKIRVEGAERSARLAEARAVDAETRAVDAEARAVEAEQRATTAEGRVAEAAQRATAAEDALAAVRATRTWRLRNRVAQFVGIRRRARSHAARTDEGPTPEGAYESRAESTTDSVSSNERS